jgi:hypothetical protein
VPQSLHSVTAPKPALANASNAVAMIHFFMAIPSLDGSYI